MNGALSQHAEICFEIETTPEGLICHPYSSRWRFLYQEATNDTQRVARAEQLRQFAPCEARMCECKRHNGNGRGARDRAEGEVHS